MGRGRREGQEGGHLQLGSQQERQFSNVLVQKVSIFEMLGTGEEKGYRGLAKHSMQGVEVVRDG